LLILQPGSCCPESPYRANATADEEYNTADCHRTNPGKLPDAGTSGPGLAVFLQQISCRIGFNRGLLTTIMTHRVAFALPLLILLSM
jgi:hypothetical protein